MAMGRERDRQGDLMVTWAEMPHSPGHVFYERLQEVLIAGGFDVFVETACQTYYAPKMGAPSVPPGRYFRMHMVGYFEGIASERGIAWRCSDSMSLRDFLRLENREKVPDHSWLSKTRGRLPHEVHETVFSWVLKLLAERGLVKGKQIGVDASTMEANAALRTIVRREDGRTYREMLTQMAKESGIETPSADDLVRIDRSRKGKKLSNEEWISKTDPEAKIAKLKDGRTHLAYKPEHAVDLDTGVIVAAALHPADEGDTTTIAQTRSAAEKNLAQINAAPTSAKPSELVTDKGYYSRAVLKDLDGGAWKTRIAEPKQQGFARWHGDDKARAAVYANRARLCSGIGKQAMRRRAEIVERSFAHNLDRGGMRRTWLRGRENVHKRYLVHVAGHNLGILMRLLIGAGTPKAAADRASAWLFFAHTEEAAVLILLAASREGIAVLMLVIVLDQTGTSATGC
jgi:transposase